MVNVLHWYRAFSAPSRTPKLFAMASHSPIHTLMDGCCHARRCPIDGNLGLSVRTCLQDDQLGQSVSTLREDGGVWSYSMWTVACDFARSHLNTNTVQSNYFKEFQRVFCLLLFRVLSHRRTGKNELETDLGKKNTLFFWFPKNIGNFQLQLWNINDHPATTTRSSFFITTAPLTQQQ